MFCRDLPSCQLPEFKYTSAEALDGTLIRGDLDQYNGGGYVFRIKGANKDLRWDIDNAPDRKKKLGKLLPI